MKTLRPLNAAIVFLVLGAAGCISAGRPFAYDKVRSIQLNKSTAADVTSMFGDPYRKGVEDGDTTWTYVDDHFNIAGGQATRDLFIRFGPDGTVKSYSYNSNVPDQPAK